MYHNTAKMGISTFIMYVRTYPTLDHTHWFYGSNWVNGERTRTHTEVRRVQRWGMHNNGIIRGLFVYHLNRAFRYMDAHGGDGGDAEEGDWIEDNVIRTYVHSLVKAQRALFIRIELGHTHMYMYMHAHVLYKNYYFTQASHYTATMNSNT